MVALGLGPDVPSMTLLRPNHRRGICGHFSTVDTGKALNKCISMIVPPNPTKLQRHDARVVLAVSQPTGH
jgi:hypothetical protein